MLLAALLCSFSVAAQTVTDGDTIKLGGTIYRLWGIDAPESKQACADGWAAGTAATAYLADMMRGKRVVCEAKTQDRYGRTVAAIARRRVDIELHDRHLPRRRAAQLALNRVIGLLKAHREFLAFAGLQPPHIDAERLGEIADSPRLRVGVRLEFVNSRLAHRLGAGAFYALGELVLRPLASLSLGLYALAQCIHIGKPSRAVHNGGY